MTGKGGDGEGSSSSDPKGPQQFGMSVICILKYKNCKLCIRNMQTGLGLKMFGFRRGSVIFTDD